MKRWQQTLELDRPLVEVHWTQAAPGMTEAEVRAREEAAYQRGRRDGEKALGEQLLRQRAELIELQNGVLESLRQVVPRVARDCESALVELALEVAQKLVAGLPITPAMVEAVVRDALAQVEETTEIQVCLHPDDLALLQQVNSPLLLPAGGMDVLQFVKSPEVSRGGCLIKTRFGLIDARRETRMQMIRSTLMHEPA